METLTLTNPTQAFVQTLTTEEYKHRVKTIFPSAKFKFIKAYTQNRSVRYGLVCVGGKAISCSVQNEDQSWKTAYEFVSKAIKIPLPIN